MSDPRFAFINGTLVLDKQVIAQAPVLLTCLQPIRALSTCTSEKGEKTLDRQSTIFPATSIFGAIESSISRDPLLVCDDLGDEWADYIGIDEANNRVTLYHAKHGAPTSGASAFQTDVSQAVKNLGRLGAVRADLETKKGHWAGRYSAPNVATRIDRIRQGASADAVIDAYERVVACAAPRPRVALVTSFLSKAEVEATVERIVKRGELQRHDHQRVWLLTSFVSECKNHGAEPIIFCAP